MASILGKEFFDIDYFHGAKKNAYFDYERMNASKMFSGQLAFIKDHHITGKIIDVGCALGLFLRELNSDTNELYGCDISEYAIQKARDNVPNAKFQVVDLEDFVPYPDDYFDCITALDVIEHTSDYEKVWETLVKKIKHGGFLIISMPTLTWVRKVMGFMDKDISHVSILKKEQIYKLIQKYQLDIVEENHYCLFPFVYRIPFPPVVLELLLQKH